MKLIQFGCGKWGQNHYRILSELGHTVDVVELPGHHRNLSPADVCDDTLSYDAALITCSTVNHFPLITQLYNKIPLFCEKPICTNHAQLLLLRRLAASHPDAIFQSGHQLLFMPQLDAIRTHRPSYIMTQRTGAIPRHEGAVLSLAVHDIAIATSITTSLDAPTIINATGDLHNAHALISWPADLTFDLTVQSLSPLRLRHLTAVFPDTRIDPIHLHPDNWNKPNLLKLSLEYFLSHVKDNKVPYINGPHHTITTMQLTLDLHRAING